MLLVGVVSPPDPQFFVDHAASVITTAVPQSLVDVTSYSCRWRSEAHDPHAVA